MEAARSVGDVDGKRKRGEKINGKEDKQKLFPFSLEKSKDRKDKTVGKTCSHKKELVPRAGPPIGWNGALEKRGKAHQKSSDYRYLP